MNPIQIEEISTPKSMRQFVDFPNQLYKNNPNYVPSLVNDELDTLNPKKNPVFDQAEARFFLAFKNQTVVGRVACMINHHENNTGNNKLRFGWFDTIDDLAVTQALMHKAESVAKENKLSWIEGPVGFNNLDKAGMVVEGFDKRATMVTWYNHAYYPQHLEQLGFTKSTEWIEYMINVPEVLPDKITRLSKIVHDKYGFKALKFNSKKDILPYFDKMFDLLHQTYKVLPTFVPISHAQKDYIKKKYLPLIHKDLLVCVVTPENELIGFAIAMPSYVVALQKTKGKLFPFGWLEFLKASKNNPYGELYLIGVQPHYQSKGVNAVVLDAIHHQLKKNGIKWLESNPELEDNKSIQAMWKDFDKTLIKRRRSYKKQIS